MRFLSLCLLALLVGLVVSDANKPDNTELHEDERTDEEKKEDALDDVIDQIMDREEFHGTRRDAKKEAKKFMKKLNHLKRLQMKVLACQYPDEVKDEEPEDLDSDVVDADMQVDDAQLKIMIEEMKLSLDECKKGGAGKSDGKRGTDGDKRSIKDFSVWPGGKWGPIIEYDVSALRNLPSTDQTLAAVLWSFEQYHKYVPCLSFRSVNSCNNRDNCMQFTVVPPLGPSSCHGNSPVGKRAGTHNINLSPCKWERSARSVIIHEIGHSFGLPHTQARPDRDDYVKINLHNAVQNAEHNFIKERVGTVTTFGLPYDFHSIMHYGPYTFAKTDDGNGNRIDPQIVIQTKNSKYQNVIGEAVNFSEEDKQLMNKAYCDASDATPAVCLKDGKRYNENSHLQVDGTWVKTCKEHNGQMGFFYDGCVGDDGKNYFNDQEFTKGGNLKKCVADASSGSVSYKSISCGFNWDKSYTIRAGCVKKIPNGSWTYVVWCVDTGRGTSTAYSGAYGSSNAAAMNSKVNEALSAANGMKMC